MFVNPAIANLIRENKIPQIEQMISLNQSTGMITKKLSIENLLKRGIITKETADKYSFDVSDNTALMMDSSSMPPGSGQQFSSGLKYGSYHENIPGTASYLNKNRR